MPRKSTKCFSRRGAGSGNAIANFDLYVQTWSVRACGQRPIRKLSFRAETDYLLSPSSGRILRAANIVDNVTEDCALQQLASVFLQNITTCRFVVESPLNPQEAVDFRSSASYSHRGSLVVHEVSFPGNTNLQAPVRLCLEMLSPDRKQKQMMQVHVFFTKKHAFANAQRLQAPRNTGHIGKTVI